MKLDQHFGLKEMYQTVLKAVSPMTLGAREIEAGEPILYFDKIQVAMLTENVQPKYARGGRDNSPRVIWEDRKEVKFRMDSGVLSSTGLAMLTSARMLEDPIDSHLSIPYMEVAKPDSTGKITLRYPVDVNNPCFCYIYIFELPQEKVVISNISGNTITVDPQFYGQNMLIDYYFLYEGQTKRYILEKDRFNGLFTLEGKYYFKGEMDGLNKTAVLTMPRVRLLSNLAIRTGEHAGSPTMSSFNIVARPHSTQYSESTILDILELDNDIG